MPRDPSYWRASTRWLVTQSFCRYSHVELASGEPAANCLNVSCGGWDTVGFWFLIFLDCVFCLFDCFNMLSGALVSFKKKCFLVWGCCEHSAPVGCCIVLGTGNLPDRLSLWWEQVYSGDGDRTQKWVFFSPTAFAAVHYSFRFTFQGNGIFEFWIITDFQFFKLMGNRLYFSNVRSQKSFLFLIACEMENDLPFLK